MHVAYCSLCSRVSPTSPGCRELVCECIQEHNLVAMSYLLQNGWACTVKDHYPDTACALRERMSGAASEFFDAAWDLVLQVAPAPCLRALGGAIAVPHYATE